jgi:hypothetical protein
MADNIKTLDQNVSAPRADSAGSQAFEMEGRHVEADYATAGNAIGGAIQHGAAEWEQHEALVETSKITNGFADLEMQTAQNLEKAKTTMDPHDTNTASDFVSQHQDALTAIGSDLTTKQGRAMFERMQANYKVSTFNKVIGYQSAAAADEVVTNFKQGFDTRSNLAQQDPTSVGAQIEAVKAAAPGLPAEHRDSILKAGVTQIADSGAEGIVNQLLNNKNLTAQDIDTAKAYLNDEKNPFLSNMSPGQFASVNFRLDRMKTTAGNVASEIAAQTLAAGNKQIEENGGVDPNNQYKAIIDNYQAKTSDETALKKAEFQRNYDAAVAVGKATKEVKTTPDAELTGDLVGLKKIVDGAEPEQAQKAEATLKAVTEAKKARDEAFTKDPADWVNKNNDVIGARYQQFAQNPTPQNFQSYAASSIAEQRRLYPLKQPRIVSADMQATIGEAVSKVTNDPAGASAAGNILSSYARTAGSYWPQMAQELYKSKTLNANQFVAASLYSKPGASSLAEEILRASVVPQKELIDKNLGNPDVTEAKVRAAANSAFGALDRTMLDDRSETRIVGGYETALTTLMLSRGTSSSSVAHDLAAKMINDEYSFKGTYRVPTSARVNADDVDAGLKSALGRVTDANSGIASANLIIPPSYSGLGPNDQRRAYVANVQAQGHWVTNSDETGAVLYDEQNHPVWQKGPGGKPQMVGLKWADAANAGVTARGLPGKAYKFIMGQE